MTSEARNGDNLHCLVRCPDCGGDGKQRCDNPDHGFICAVGGEIGRLGCPVCGHDPDHKTNDPCEACDGTGKQPAGGGFSGLTCTQCRCGEWFYDCPGNDLCFKCRKQPAEGVKFGMSGANGDSLDCLVGGIVHLAYYHNGFTDDPPVLLDVCDSATAADEAIAVHKEQRDTECEYEDNATWWTETRGIRTANAEVESSARSE